LFAMVIYIGIMYVWGEEFLPTENAKYGVSVNEVGKEIGFQNGDKILTIDNKYIESFNAIIPTIVLDDAKTVQVERNGQKMDVEISDSDLALLLKSKSVMVPRTPFDIKVGKVEKHSPAQTADLHKDDIFSGVDGLKFEFYDQFS